MAEATARPELDTATRVATTVAAVAAALVAQAALAAGWRMVTGHSAGHPAPLRTVTGRSPAPSPGPDDDSPLTEVLVFAAISAATVAVARTWAARKTRDYMVRSR